MNSSPLAILLIIAISAAVFGGIVFFGLKSGTGTTPPSPVTTGTRVRIPDILNLPGFRSDQAKPTNALQPPQTSNADVVVEKSELPSPTLPVAPSQSQPPRQKIQMPTPPRMSTPVFIPVPQPQPIPQPVPAPALSSQTAAIASFSVFTSSPQLRDLRTKMVQEGVIQETEFGKINNNRDMEQFLLKMVEWQARKAGSTDAQIQDALDRIRKAYDQVKR